MYESHLILWQNYGKQNLILPDFEGKFTEIIRLKMMGSNSSPKYIAELLQFSTLLSDL